MKSNSLENNQDKPSGHGGRRAGSGRKAGSVTLKTRAKAEEIAADGGLQPLDYMLSVLRNEELSHEDRMDAAKSAAPYIHAKLAAVDATVKGDMSFTVVVNKP